MKKKPAAKRKAPKASKSDCTKKGQSKANRPPDDLTVNASSDQERQKVAGNGRDLGSPTCDHSSDAVEPGSEPLADPKDEQMATFLAAGGTKTAAASDVGVGDRTVYRRLEQREFNNRVKFLRIENNERIAARLGQHANMALDLFAGVLQPDVPYMHHVRAAAMILDRWIKVSEREHKSAREAQLETEITALTKKYQELEARLPARHPDN